MRRRSSPSCRVGRMLRLERGNYQKPGTVTIRGCSSRGSNGDRNGREHTRRLNVSAKGRRDESRGRSLPPLRARRSGHAFRRSPGQCNRSTRTPRPGIDFGVSVMATHPPVLDLHYHAGPHLTFFFSFFLSSFFFLMVWDADDRTRNCGSFLHL